MQARAAEMNQRDLSARHAQNLQEQSKVLEESQPTLYQSEKLQAVGRLAAGVAHEINNPLGFMRSNLNTARSYARKLAALGQVAEGQVPPDARITLELKPLPRFVCTGARINQVFLNLVLNGAQAIGPDGEIKVDSVFSDGEIRIGFEDNGCGIAQEHLARVFEPFFTTRPVGAGTGLGLTVSRDIVHRYGGRLDIASRPGQGTRVSICLPVPGGGQAAP